MENIKKEFKLVFNSGVARRLLKMGVNISDIKADRAKSGIFMIIVEDDSYDTIKGKLEKIQAEMKEKGEYIPEVIYVNGKKQVSASKPNYQNPKL